MDLRLDTLQYPILLSTCTLIASCALTGVATVYARRRGLVDLPGDRHSHVAPTPRGGGLGLVLALLAGGAWLWPSAEVTWLKCVLPGFGVLAALGWWDDHHSLSPWWRLAVQLMVSFVLVGCLGQFAGVVAMPVLLLSALFIAWMTNLYNFMDGSNGMAGLQGVFGGFALAWLFHSAGDHPAAMFSALVAAACLGFLPWNLGRARVFMGDVGSGPLGFLFAGLLVYGVLSGRFSGPVAWLLMLVFLCDATLTLLLRVMRGERCYTPHKQHLYQRLIDRGWPHGRVALLYQSINLALVAPVIAVAVKVPALSVGLATALSLGLGAAWLLAMRKLGVLARAG